MKKIILFLGLALVTLSVHQVKAQTSSYEEFEVEGINDKQTHYLSKSLGLSIDQISQIKIINHKRLMERTKSNNDKNNEVIDQKYYLEMKDILHDFQKENWASVIENLAKIK